MTHVPVQLIWNAIKNVGCYVTIAWTQVYHLMVNALPYSAISSLCKVVRWPLSSSFRRNDELTRWYTDLEGHTVFKRVLSLREHTSDHRLLPFDVKATPSLKELPRIGRALTSKGSSLWSEARPFKPRVVNDTLYRGYHWWSRFQPQAPLPHQSPPISQ